MICYQIGQSILPETPGKPMKRLTDNQLFTIQQRASYASPGEVRGVVSVAQATANAKLQAHARKDIMALLAHIDVLEQELEAHRSDDTAQPKPT